MLFRSLLGEQREKLDLTWSTSTGYASLTGRLGLYRGIPGSSGTSAHPAEHPSRLLDRHCLVVLAVHPAHRVGNLADRGIGFDGRQGFAPFLGSTPPKLYSASIWKPIPLTEWPF